MTQGYKGTNIASLHPPRNTCILLNANLSLNYFSRTVSEYISSLQTFIPIDDEEMCDNVETTSRNRRLNDKQEIANSIGMAAHNFFVRNFDEIRKFVKQS